MTKQDASEEGASLDDYLMPDDQKRYLVFVLRLPQHLPVYHHFGRVLAMPGDFGDEWDAEAFLSIVPDGPGYFTNLREPSVSVRVWQVRRDWALPDLSPVVQVATDVFPESDTQRLLLTDDHKALELEDYVSVVEAVTQAARADTESEWQAVVSACFERSLRAVNELIEAIAAASHDPGLAAVEVERLDIAVAVASRPLDQGFDVEPIHYWLHWNMPVPRTVLGSEADEDIDAYLGATRQSQPFVSVMAWLRRAQAASNIGDYAVAVILGATAAELLLNTLLRGLLIEEGKGDQIPRLFAPDVSLARRVRRQYHDRLGGNWSLDDVHCEVGHWNLMTQRLRHRVVHGGHQPTQGEAEESHHGVELLEQFVKDRLVEHRHDYPLTTLSLLGESGLERRQSLDARMRLMIDAVAPGIREYWRAVAGDQ